MNAIKFFRIVDQQPTDLDALAIRDKVVTACKVNPLTWYQWRKRKHVGSERSRARICEVMDKPESELFQVDETPKTDHQ
jgi:hypothetical protein